MSSRQAGVYQDDGGDRNDVIVVFTLLLFTCVSCSLARSSRKRFIALKTSSLEVFDGSHLHLDDNQWIHCNHQFGSVINDMDMCVTIFAW